MADVKKMATREGYGKALVELGKEHDDIVVLDADLAGSTKTGTELTCAGSLPVLRCSAAALPKRLPRRFL